MNVKLQTEGLTVRHRDGTYESVRYVRYETGFSIGTYAASPARCGSQPHSLAGAVAPMTVIFVSFPDRNFREDFRSTP